MKTGVRLFLASDGTTIFGKIKEEILKEITGTYGNTVDWETQKLNLVYKAFVEMMQEIEEQKTPDNEEEKEDEE